jgi:hypothetical protein
MRFFCYIFSFLIFSSCSSQNITGIINLIDHTKTFTPIIIYDSLITDTLHGNIVVIVRFNVDLCDTTFTLEPETIEVSNFRLKNSQTTIINFSKFQYIYLDSLYLKRYESSNNFEENEEFIIDEEEIGFSLQQFYFHPDSFYIKVYEPKDRSELTIDELRLFDKCSEKIINLYWQQTYNSIRDVLKIGNEDASALSFSCPFVIVPKDD